MSGVARCVTLEALDAIFLALYGSSSIDTVGAESLDSARWKGGAPLFAAIGTDFKLYTFSGSNQAAQMDTIASVLTGNTGMVSKITGARALIDSDSYTIQLATSATHGGVSTASFGSNATGSVNAPCCGATRVRVVVTCQSMSNSMRRTALTNGGNTLPPSAPPSAAASR